MFVTILNLLTNAKSTAVAGNIHKASLQKVNTHTIVEKKCSPR